MSEQNEIEVYAAILHAVTNVNRRNAKRILHDEKWLGLNGAQGVEEALRRIQVHPRRQEIVERAKAMKNERPESFFFARSPDSEKQYLVYRGLRFAMMAEINPATRQLGDVDWIIVPPVDFQRKILANAQTWLTYQDQQK